MDNFMDEYMALLREGKFEEAGALEAKRRAIQDEEVKERLKEIEEKANRGFQEIEDMVNSSFDRVQDLVDRTFD